MSWRDVLDCKIFPMSLGGFLRVVEITRYKFFAWNGRIYSYHKGGDYEDTGLTTEDLE